jgi:predicted HAD superfamily Cof-like phosphohydrolase
MVRGFHNALGATIGRSPALRDRELRAKLIMEEAVETVAAMGFGCYAVITDKIPATQVIQEFSKAYDEPNFVDAIDGLVDTIYVVLGAAVAWGIDLDPFFAEVHRANMAKLGGGMREDGKFLKPDNWTGPDITGILDREVKWGEDPSLNEWGVSDG